MPKNISIYIPDKLLNKMNEFQEVNWSEIARNAIEDYTTGRIKIDNRLRESERYLTEIQMYRNQLMHDIENVKNIIQVGDSRLEMIYETKINTELEVRLQRPTEISLLFKIFNLLDYDILLDRLLYDVKLITQNKIMTTINGAYLRRHRINTREKRNINDSVCFDVKVLETITNEIKENEGDVSLAITTISYYNNQNGIIEHADELKYTIAHSAWIKWYNAWAHNYGLSRL